MDRYKDFLQVVLSIKNNYSSYISTPVWAGETSTAYDEGAANMSNTFVDGFIWLDKLGLSALNSIEVNIRQDFWGFYYSVINQQGIPNPVSFELGNNILIKILIQLTNFF